MYVRHAMLQPTNQMHNYEIFEQEQKVMWQKFKTATTK